MHGFFGDLVRLRLFSRERLPNQFFAPERGEVIIADFLRRAPALPLQGTLNFCDLALVFLNLRVVFRERGGKLGVLPLKVRKPEGKSCNNLLSNTPGSEP